MAVLLVLMIPSSGDQRLSIYDSYFGMILPLLVDAAGVFIMKNFFESIPASVEEQARIDGVFSARSGQSSCQWQCRR